MEETLIDPLKEIMNKILEKGEMPGTWGESYLTLIPKQGADTTLPSNYRPIALLNNDYKLFAAILADRLKNILVMVIHEDQTGFLPKRLMQSNIRNIINIIEYLDICIDKPGILIAVDAEKAFDQISWKFMKATIEKMDLGKSFCKGIQAIYTKP